jgi:hypothetical protein
MTSEEFWKLIDKARREAEGDGEATGEVVQELLSEKPANEIRSFAEQLNTHMSSSYSRAIGEAFMVMLGDPDGHFSEDLFEYFRAWLITRGRKVFESILADADNLAAVKVEDPVEECSSESLLYAPDHAYSEVTGEESELIILDSQRDWVPAAPDNRTSGERLSRLYAKHVNGK